MKEEKRRRRPTYTERPIVLSGHRFSSENWKRLFNIIII